MFLFAYIILGAETVFPKVDVIFTVHLWITGILMVLSLIYIIPPVYMKSQQLQYLLIILVTQNLVGVFLYISAIFIIAGMNGMTEEKILTITFLTLFWGLIVFVIASIRLYILLLEDHQGPSIKKDEQKSHLGVGKKSYVPVIIGISIVVTLIILSFFEEETIMKIDLIIHFMLFSFMMVFFLPKQLVILYCKVRFDSFNYSKKGKLKPFRRQKKRRKRK